MDDQVHSLNSSNPNKTKHSKEEYKNEENEENEDEYSNSSISDLKQIIKTIKSELQKEINSKQDLLSKINKNDIRLREYQNELNEYKKKAEDIGKYQNEISRLHQKNESLSMAQNQLLQTSELQTEHAKRLETDLHEQMSSHTESNNDLQKLSTSLQEQLERTLSEIHHLQSLNESHQMEISSLTNRNEQISLISQETIEDLSQELAEEKDGHSTIKHKYHNLRDEFTKLKIKFDKRGTELNRNKKDLQKSKLRLLLNDEDKKNNENVDINNASNANNMQNKQQINLLYRQLENYRNEINGTSQHLDHCKSYLQTTLNYLEQVALLNNSPLNNDNNLNIDQIYDLCKDSRTFLGIDELPPEPEITTIEDSPSQPIESSPEAFPGDDVKELHPPNITSKPLKFPISAPPKPKYKTKNISPPMPSMPEEPINTPSPEPPNSMNHNVPILPPPSTMPSKPILPPSNDTFAAPIDLPSDPPVVPKKKKTKKKSKKQKTSKSKAYNTPNTDFNKTPMLPVPTMPDDIDNNHQVPLPIESVNSNYNAKPIQPPNAPQPPHLPSPSPINNKLPPNIPNSTENNKKKKLIKKKSKRKVTDTKKKKKDPHTMEKQKVHLTNFFTIYSDSKNWKEGGKEYGVQKYILHFAEREPLNARMAFLYSMTLYLGQIVGVNKRCITHAFMLFKSVRAQIDTLCEEFSLILQTLEFHKDDKLWKYVYSFLYNAAAYFKHIQKFVGTRTSVANPKQYAKKIKKNSSMDSRRESTQFRKLSGLSEIDDSNSNISGMSNTSANSVYKQQQQRQRKKKYPQ